MSDALGDALRQRLRLARADLMEAWSRVTDPMLPWAPAEGMRPLGDLMREILATELEIVAVLRDGHAGDYAEHWASAGCDTSGAYAARAFDVRAATLAWLDAQTDAALRAPRPMPDAWWPGLGLAQAPAHEVVRSIAQHEAYHTGQLVSYLWARGDDPYAW